MDAVSSKVKRGNPLPDLDQLDIESLKALVLAKHGKQCVDLLFVFWFAAWRLPSFESSDRMLARTPVAGASLILRTKRLRDPSLGLYSLPLQV